MYSWEQIAGFVVSYAIAGLLMAALNRVRGGGLDVLKLTLSGKPNLWASIMVGGLYMAHTNLIEGLVIGVGFWVWSLLGWGHWFDLHRNDAYEDPERNRGIHGAIVDAMSFGSDHAALVIRHLWCAPLFTALAWLHDAWWMLAGIPLFALGIVAIFEVMWRMFPDTSPRPGMQTHAIAYAEVGTGVLWWALLTPAVIL